MNPDELNGWHHTGDTTVSGCEGEGITRMIPLDHRKDSNRNPTWLAVSLARIPIGIHHGAGGQLREGKPAERLLFQPGKFC